MIEDYNVFKLNRSQKIMLFAALISATVLMGIIFYRSILPSTAAVFIYAKAEKIYCRYCARRRKNMLILQFRDLLFSISSSFAVGRHMEEALEEAKISIREIYGDDSIISREISHMLREISETGASDIEVWEDFSARSQLEDVEDFTQIFRACRETGGNIISAANKAARIIGEKISIESEIRTMASQKKFEGRIITVMPVVIVIFLRMVSPDYLEVMYSTLTGRIMMSVALTAIIVAYFIIERITKIEI